MDVNNGTSINGTSIDNSAAHERAIYNSSNTNDFRRDSTAKQNSQTAQNDNMSHHGTTTQQPTAAGNINVGGNYNSSYGLGAGAYILTGHYNTCLGTFSGNVITDGGSNICVGYASDVSASGATYQVVIGRSSTGKGNNTGFMNANSGGNYAGNNSASWSTTSDKRIKKNIVDSTKGLAEINQIQVRNFEYRLPEEIEELPETTAINKEGLQVGVIAQEVIDILPDIVKQESTGVYSVDPDNVTWHLVKAVQELSAEIEELKEKLNGSN